MGQIESFDQEQGDDWTTYFERLEQYFVANGITQADKKVAVFITVIGSKTYGLLRNLLTPEKPADKTYGQLVEVMKNHLSPKPLIIAKRLKFHRRNQMDQRVNRWPSFSQS